MKMRRNPEQQIAHVISVGTEDLTDFVVGQPFALSHMPHFLHILFSKSAVPRTILFRHIRHIFGGRSEKEMVRPDAPSVIAFVANEKLLRCYQHRGGSSACGSNYAITTLP
jgi:hypothetical protein